MKIISIEGNHLLIRIVCVLLSFQENLVTKSLEQWLFSEKKIRKVLFLGTLYYYNSQNTLLSQGWTNFFLGVRFFGCVILFACTIGHAKKGAQNQSARPIEAKVETLLFAFYYLNTTHSFYFKCVFIKHFCNEAFVV